MPRGPGWCASAGPAEPRGSACSGSGSSVHLGEADGGDLALEVGDDRPEALVDAREPVPHLDGPRARRRGRTAHAGHGPTIDRQADLHSPLMRALGTTAAALSVLLTAACLGSADAMDAPAPGTRSPTTSASPSARPSPSSSSDPERPPRPRPTAPTTAPVRPGHPDHGFRRRRALRGLPRARSPGTRTASTSCGRPWARPTWRWSTSRRPSPSGAPRSARSSTSGPRPRRSRPGPARASTR